VKLISANPYTDLPPAREGALQAPLARSPRGAGRGWARSLTLLGPGGTNLGVLTFRGIRRGDCVLASHAERGQIVVGEPPSGLRRAFTAATLEQQRAVLQVDARADQRAGRVVGQVLDIPGRLFGQGDANWGGGFDRQRSLVVV